MPKVFGITHCVDDAVHNTNVEVRLNTETILIY
jgi:hypothetical protein